MKIVYVPGYGSSEPDHWQSLWHKEDPSGIWIEQKDWLKPDQKEWEETLHTLTCKEKEPLLFIAHSLGCITVVDWAKKYAKEADVVGALLVAPPDVEGLDEIIDIIGYECINLEKLPFKSTVVFSSNDPYASEKRSLEYAASWGSRAICVGEKGHINLASHLGEWEEGKNILSELL